jgi:hypothetical protein
MLKAAGCPVNGCVDDSQYVFVISFRAGQANRNARDFLPSSNMPFLKGYFNPVEDSCDYVLEMVLEGQHASNLKHQANTICQWMSIEGQLTPGMKEGSEQLMLRYKGSAQSTKQGLKMLEIACKAYHGVLQKSIGIHQYKRIPTGEQSSPSNL